MAQDRVVKNPHDKKNTLITTEMGGAQERKREAGQKKISGLGGERRRALYTR